MKSLQNISSSVRQRLLNRSRDDNRAFNEILQYYAIERFLYRLSLSSHANKYILKGGVLLRAWSSSDFRSTMDIDVLGKTRNEEANIIAQVQDIISIEVVPDGILFDSNSIQTERITEDADYSGIRVRFSGSLGTAKIRMQIDIGFGDVVYPEPEIASLPCMLDFPAPSLLCYSRESTIAEKFEAMIKLGYLNSRMKDFYDIWFLSRQFNFELASLSEAVKCTCKQRGTELTPNIEAFTEDFISTHQAMWIAFCKRLKQDYVSLSFEIIVKEVEIFLSPIITNVTEKRIWVPAGPWV